MGESVKQAGFYFCIVTLLEGPVRSQAFFFFSHHHFNYCVTGTSFCSRKIGGSSAGRQVWINKVEISPQADFTCQFKIGVPCGGMGEEVNPDMLRKARVFHFDT